MDEDKKTATVEESLAAIKKTLYHLNGTFMKEGEHGKNVESIAQSLDKLTMEKGLLEKINWNLGSIATALKKLAENSDKMLK